MNAKAQKPNGRHSKPIRLRGFGSILEVQVGYFRRFTRTFDVNKEVRIESGPPRLITSVYPNAGNRPHGPRCSPLWSLPGSGFPSQGHPCPCWRVPRQWTGAAPPRRNHHQQPVIGLHLLNRYHHRHLNLTKPFPLPALGVTSLLNAGNFNAMISSLSLTAPSMNTPATPF